MSDEKDILFDNIKNQIRDQETIEKLEELAENYKGKSENEIFVEIIRLNEEMEETLGEEQYNEIFSKLESIRPYLTEEQNKKLNIILKSINKE